MRARGEKSKSQTQLQRVPMVVPNRPHNQRNSINKKKTKFLRRRTFYVSTDEFGFRKSDTFEKTRKDTKIIGGG